MRFEDLCGIFKYVCINVGNDAIVSLPVKFIWSELSIGGKYSTVAPNLVGPLFAFSLIMYYPCLTGNNFFNCRCPFKLYINDVFAIFTAYSTIDRKAMFF